MGIGNRTVEGPDAWMSPAPHSAGPPSLTNQLALGALNITWVSHVLVLYYHAQESGLQGYSTCTLVSPWKCMVLCFICVFLRGAVCILWLFHSCFVFFFVSVCLWYYAEVFRLLPRFPCGVSWLATCSRLLLLSSAHGQRSGRNQVRKLARRAWGLPPSGHIACKIVVCFCIPALQIQAWLAWLIRSIPEVGFCGEDCLQLVHITFSWTISINLHKVH